jgi:hypothetical protein
MQIRTALLVVCLLALGVSRAEAQFNAPAPAPGEDFHVELGLMLWTPTPELTIQTGALAAIGETEVDLVKEFAIEDKRFTEFRVVVRGGRKHKIRFNYVPFEYNEEATLSRTVTFGGRTFAVGIPATADLKWQMWKIGYEYDIASGDRGFFGIIAELKHNKVTATLASPVSGSELTEATAPVPTLGIIGRAYPTRDFSITTEFTGFKLPAGISDRFDAKMFDFDIYGTINFGSHVGVQGGYRSLVAEYLVDDDAGHFKLKGLYFGGLLRF